MYFSWRVFKTKWWHELYLPISSLNANVAFFLCKLSGIIIFWNKEHLQLLKINFYQCCEILCWEINYVWRMACCVNSKRNVSFVIVINNFLTAYCCEDILKFSSTEVFFEEDTLNMKIIFLLVRSSQNCVARWVWEKYESIAERCEFWRWRCVIFHVLCKLCMDKVRDKNVQAYFTMNRLIRTNTNYVPSI